MGNKLEKKAGWLLQNHFSLSGIRDLSGRLPSLVLIRRFLVLTGLNSISGGAKIDIKSLVTWGLA